MPIYFLRHGRTAANAKGLFQGRVDNPLDTLGHRQAASAAAWIGPVDKVVSSPLLRARETAAAFGEPIVVDERFIELDYGDWDERPVSDVSAEEWATWRSDETFRVPGGESLLDVSNRVCGALEEFALSPGIEQASIVVVSHVSPIKAAAIWAMGAGHAVVWHLRLGQATVTRIEVAPRRALVTFNETPPLLDD